MTEEMGTESARRVADLLIELGAAVTPIGVNELARRVGISPTVAHRMLQALLSRDLAAQTGESQKYTLGTAALQLGGGAFARLDFQRLAHPLLERLVAETHLTATLSVLTGTRRMYLDQALPPAELRLSVELGVPYGLTRGSTGRAILAQLPDATIERIVAAESTPDDPIVPADYAQRIAEVRRVGYAIARGERIDGAGGVAVAFGESGRTLVGAVNVLGPMNLFDDARATSYARALQRAAEEVEQLLRPGAAAH